MATETTVKVAAVGFQGTHEWDLMGLTSIIEIIVSRSKDRLYTLQFTDDRYVEKIGFCHPSVVAGSGNFAGGMLKVITFKGGKTGKEYVKEVKGMYHTGSDGQNIKKLSIRTNKKVYTVFEAKGLANADYKKFSFKFMGLIKFGGLHGTQNNDGEITSIGVYFINPSGPNLSSSVVGVETDLVHGSTSN